MKLETIGPWTGGLRTLLAYLPHVDESSSTVVPLDIQQTVIRDVVLGSMYPLVGPDADFSRGSDRGRRGSCCGHPRGGTAVTAATDLRQGAGHRCPRDPTLGSIAAAELPLISPRPLACQIRGGCRVAAGAADRQRVSQVRGRRRGALGAHGGQQTQGEPGYGTVGGGCGRLSADPLAGVQAWVPTGSASRVSPGCRRAAHGGNYQGPWPWGTGVRAGADGRYAGRGYGGDGTSSGLRATPGPSWARGRAGVEGVRAGIRFATWGWGAPPVFGFWADLLAASGPDSVACPRHWAAREGDPS